LDAAVEVVSLSPKFEHTSPSKPLMGDKWAALGARRRASQTPLRAISCKPATPVSTPIANRKRSRRIGAAKSLNWNIWGQGHQNWNASAESLSVGNKKPWILGRDWRPNAKGLHGTSFNANGGRPLEWVWRRMDSPQRVF